MGGGVVGGVGVSAMARGLPTWEEGVEGEERAGGGAFWRAPSWSSLVAGAGGLAAAAQAGGHDELADRHAGQRHLAVDRRRVGRGFHRGGMRPVEGDRAPLRPGRMGRVELRLHSQDFWELRLHLLCTMHGLPVGFALTGAKADERQVLLGILADPALTAGRAGQIIIGDKNYYGGGFEATLAGDGLCLLRPARKGEAERAGARFFKPLRQIIESVNDTFKGQLDLGRHGGHTKAGVMVRVLQRILALTAAIWHSDRTGQPVERSLVAYDH